MKYLYTYIYIFAKLDEKLLKNNSQQELDSNNNQISRRLCIDLFFKSFKILGIK